MKSKDKSVWMSAKEVMAALEVSRKVVLKLANAGAIIRRDTSGHRRYSRESVELLMASQQKQPA